MADIWVKGLDVNQHEVWTCKKADAEVMAWPSGSWLVIMVEGRIAAGYAARADLYEAEADALSGYNSMTNAPASVVQLPAPSAPSPAVKTLGEVFWDARAIERAKFGGVLSPWTSIDAQSRDEIEAAIQEALAEGYARAAKRMISISLYGGGSSPQLTPATYKAAVLKSFHDITDRPHTTSGGQLQHPEAPKKPDCPTCGLDDSYHARNHASGVCSACFDAGKVKP